MNIVSITAVNFIKNVNNWWSYCSYNTIKTANINQLYSTVVQQKSASYNNNNNNNHNNVYGAVIVAREPLREFTRFIWWIWNSARRPLTFRPSQTTWDVSLPVGCQKPHPSSPFTIITQPESWYSFYHPTEGRRLSWPRHCSKGVQPLPKAVYRSGFYEKRATAHSEIWTLVLSHHSQARYR